LVLTSCTLRFDLGNSDWTYLYDFDMKTTTQQSLASYTLDRADWPVTFIFYGPGASIDRVGDILRRAGSNETGTGKMQMPQRDAPKSWERDLSGGEKDTLRGVQCPGPRNRYDYLHMRYYADPDDDHIDGSGWKGKVVVGTTHYDFKEHCPDQSFGYSEDAAEEWERRIRGLGYSVHEDVKMANEFKLGRKAGKSNYWWQSDGRAARVYVP
jgi:hypothetical protein